MGFLAKNCFRSDIDSHRPYRKTDYHALAYNAYNYIAVYLYEICV